MDRIYCGINPGGDLNKLQELVGDDVAGWVPVCEHTDGPRRWSLERTVNGVRQTVDIAESDFRSLVENWESLRKLAGRA